ncbi:PhzF family phenazine biosynthesis protein [Kibdelosporangium philippinense]|uniref:PhzF family phenazine biosynthesis protein n=1 Tax=Kibdelosporangium philippinense TaxID=211113 RepID=A0ABS8Z843_9PSEU|nr:PhzF family phenazine biosynthesis protein [Kibdelosporangium philippinense]MCE7003995.1 PhzF family phenazine biosynthesis protein [Kibdelosporangium philippinense]
MRIRIIDAFSDQPFRGNPAAVCLLEDTWPDEGWMRQVAAEMNLSETAFAHPVDDPDADYALRWFTPEVETDLCGHATLATAHALHEDRGTSATVRFSTRSGILVAHSFDDGTITLDFPAASLEEAEEPAGLAEALGTRPVAVYRTGALGDLLVVLSDEDTVRGLRPDLLSIARIEREQGIRGVIVTARSAEYDFVSRFFAPQDGIREDPVTGSAHTALAPYWASRTGKTSLVGLQASRRTGVVRTEVHGDRVHLTGHAVTVLDGFLQIASKAVAGSVSGGPAGSHSPS